MSLRRAPIVVMSFNRPQFLGPVLGSLAAQPAETMRDREIHLFQDGAVNAYSGTRYADDEDIEASVALFRSAFPDGVVHRSAANIGIFENFRRAETYMFRERGVDCAWFFEDDLILSPAYFEMMERMQSWADTTGRIAYFAAYGDLHADVLHHEEHQRRIMALDHHWAFGLFRRHWEAMQPLMARYAGIVGGRDYSSRDHKAVMRLFDDRETATRASSQDGFKAWVCQELRLWRCNSFLPFARYIGSTGQHMTPGIFETLGYDRTEMASQAIALDYPDCAEIECHLDRQTAAFHEIREREYPAIVARLAGGRLDPMRKCTRAEARAGYRLLLCREIADEGVIAGHAGRDAVHDFTRALTGSADFPPPPAPRRNCTADDVTYAYRLALHRDPEEAVFAVHVGRTDAHALMMSIWNDNERRLLLGSMPD